MDLPPTKPAGPVPEDLMDKLHEANGHFHQAREALEAQMSSSGYRHQERVDSAGEAVRIAEREVEEISERIGQELRSQRAPEFGGAHGDDRAERVADFEPLR